MAAGRIPRERSPRLRPLYAGKVWSRCFVLSSLIKVAFAQPAGRRVSVEGCLDCFCLRLSDREHDHRLGSPQQRVSNGQAILIDLRDVVGNDPAARLGESPSPREERGGVSVFAESQEYQVRSVVLVVRPDCRLIPDCSIPGFEELAPSRTQEGCVDVVHQVLGRHAAVASLVVLRNPSLVRQPRSDLLPAGHTTAQRLVGRCRRASTCQAHGERRL